MCTSHPATCPVILRIETRTYGAITHMFLELLGDGIMEKD